MQLVERAHTRLRRDEGGFTLIELLVVLIIIGILLAIAVPSYLGFKQRAENRAAGANVRAALPAVEAFYADNGTYVGMTIAQLKLIDQAVNLSAAPSSLAGGNAPHYCIQSDADGGGGGTAATHHFEGPGVDTSPQPGPCT
jgi:type IV pilus assembly protein PilA